MKKIKLFGKAIPLWLILIMLGVGMVIAGTVVFQLQTQYTIQEPFVIQHNLPASIETYPGDTKTYTITVTNVADSIDYTATLVYTVTADPGVVYTITPDSGASQQVPSSGSVTFQVTVQIAKDSAPGTLTIDWQILRG